MDSVCVLVVGELGHGGRCREREVRGPEQGEQFGGQAVHLFVGVIWVLFG